MGVSTNNPAFSQYAFSHMDWSAARSTTMTIAGTAGKTSILLAIVTGVAGWVWSAASHGTLNPIVLPASAIAGLVLALITIFKPTVAPFTAPAYAAAEGGLLGTISYLVNLRYPGIPIQAVALTFSVLAVMLMIYATRLIRVTQKLAIGISAATGALALFYIVAMMLSFFGVHVSIISSATPVGIGFSLLVVGLAAFNLLLDFDAIERWSAQGAPKAMEWYGAFGLLVTLVWLYLEILRLLQKFSRRD